MDAGVVTPAGTVTATNTGVLTLSGMGASVGALVIRDSQTILGLCCPFCPRWHDHGGWYNDYVSSPFACGISVGRSIPLAVGVWLFAWNGTEWNTGLLPRADFIQVHWKAVTGYAILSQDQPEHSISRTGKHMDCLLPCVVFARRLRLRSPVTTVLFSASSWNTLGGDITGTRMTCFCLFDHA